MEFTRVSVIGGGFMGAGIAEVVARSGFQVTVIEQSADQIQPARERIERSLKHALQRGKLTDRDINETLSRIELTPDLEASGNSELVIEAVYEDEHLKRLIFSKLNEVADRQAILASNTSSIPITALASSTDRPGMVVGLHFFSPVPVMPLVELVAGLDTSEDTMARARRFISDLGKQAIETKDRSGFVVNMLLVPYLISAIRMYEEGFASREAIDEGMRLGCGHPMGPLTLADFVGLDVLYSVCESLYDEFKRPEYAPPPLLKRMVIAGHVGRKTGRGFYEYGQAG